VNYYAARQRQDNGKWDFTCMNDGRGRPVGYCAEAGGSHHDTEEEAQACYRKYLLDTRVRYRSHKEGEAGTYEKCKVCGKLTNGYAEVGHLSIYFLCQEHQTREALEEVYGEVGEIWSSW